MTHLSELLKQVKTLEIKTKNLVEGMESNAYRSRFRGEGIEFSEVREYTSGDDVRRIDWNVSARYNDLYVKKFVEEKELNIFVMIDLSASNDFGSIKSKKEIGTEVAASLIFSAIKNNDRVGMGLFTDTLEKFIPAKKGRKHMMSIMQYLLDYSPNSIQTNISESLSQLQTHLKRKSIIFIISDFISDSFVKPLKYLKLKHQIVLVNISDINEIQIPDIGHAYLEDSESGEQILVNTSDKEFQKQYSLLLKKAREKTEYELKKIGADLINISNKESFDITFNRHIRKRLKN